MADREEEESKPDLNDKKIPVFTVLKNGAILKNIFILNNFPNPGNEEEVIILGRHPDCNIMLTHPSISRFHLQIHSNPSSLKLCLVDLSSVHGTWVSGKKIEAGARVEMREGNTLRVGGSSRIYRLHWVPLSRVYDFEIEKKEEEVAIAEERAVENCEKENSLLDEKKETVKDLFFGNIVEPLYSDEDWSIEMMKEVTSAPPMGEFEGMVVSPVDGGESESHLRNECPQEETCLLSKPFGNESKSLFAPLSAENLSFNVENIIMSSFFGSENKSTSSIWTMPLENESRISSSGNQQLLHHGKESPQSVSLPLSAENLSFNVENIIMSSFFSSESKSSSSNTFDQEETDRSWTIPLENKSKNLSVVDDRKPAPANGYRQFDNENQSPQTHSVPLCKENSSNVEDNDMFEQKEISSIMTIPLGHELTDEAVADDAKPISHESQNFDLENESPQSVLLSGKNLSSDVETQNLSICEVNSLIYDVGNVVETITEKEELMVEHELHPLEYNHSSVSTEERIHETETLDKIETEVEEVNVDEGNGDFYHTYQVKESLLNWQSQYINETSMKSTPEVIPNLPMNQNVGCCVEEKDTAGYETLKPTKSVQEKDHEQKELSEPGTVSSSMEFVNSSLPDEDVSLEISVEKEFQTPRSDNVSAMGDSIWLRRGKPNSFPRIETGVNRANRVGTSLTDEINHEIAEDETVVNTLLPILGEEEEEIFTPDKENFTPNTLLMKSLKKKANIEDSVKNSSRPSKSQSSIFKSRQKIKPEELSEESDKENQTPRFLQEQKLAKSISKNRRFGKDKKVMKRGGGERAPFQSLQSNLAGKKRPEVTVVNSARKSNISVCTGAMKNKFTEGKKRWTMVVDINSLLNKESMKSLKLLQGLQGTHLIVPRMVIRELDCLRRHGSLFRKTTEAASILQWIEDCMVQTRWWIHVQSSDEGGRPPATSPATPRSPYTEGSQSLLWRTASSIQSITQRSFMEVLSPTAEDHILECALHFRRGVNHGQLVLLSDDVTLKIKAMAEGLICETAKEFRESLVNPFSERFLWADSSPRGLTWSCPDDVVLRERYDRCSSWSLKGTAEGAKGLKLILLHNSHYGMLR
ncbi:FHA domain-containing protein PS1 isoform X2 [Momordica charantia]|uniref:FHA domain-containing protein PS1 isoform X2 n=1 Tax=Momordica charantia TaxID=3673 RepID=A0A6J1C011_MOMCH|nr:FHA domain-containing protein PS1 isoform X2 [Momordica charantia]